MIETDPLEAIFVAQAARPDHVTQVNMRALNPFLRALLVIDGTVTKFIEAYTMEPLQIVRLRQEARRLMTEHNWLEAAPRTPVIAREVLLRGAYSRRIYAYAVSLVMPDRLPENIRLRLQAEGDGIGRMLLDSRLETYREILWYGKEPANGLRLQVPDLQSADVISRMYRIFLNGRPVILINEKFPSDSNWLPAPD
jgi:chorismate-pyruvate lyase